MVPLGPPWCRLSEMVPHWCCAQLLVLLCARKVGLGCGRNPGNTPFVSEMGANFWKLTHSHSILTITKNRVSPDRARRRGARPTTPPAPLPHAPTHRWRWCERRANAVCLPGRGARVNARWTTSPAHHNGSGMAGESGAGAASHVFV